MVNGLGNLLSFVDTNVSSNNNTYSLNNYSYDDSFANMLNKTQTEDIYSAPSNVSNKMVERNNTEDYKNYNDYEEYNNNDYNNYDSDNVANSSSADEKISSKENNSENNTNKISENNGKEENKVSDNTEDKTVKENKDEIKSDNNAQEKTDKTNSENMSLKEKLALTKEKAKLIIQNASNNDEKKVLVNSKENSDKEAAISKSDKADKKENAKNTQDIESIKKQIEALNLEDLDEEDKKELEDLIESLETLKAMIDADNNIEEEKEVSIEDIKDDIEVKETDSADNKEIKIASNKENEKNIETKDINVEETAVQTDNTIMADANIDMNNVENKYADKDTDVKNNNNNNAVNNTISDDKGAELTIINMKDSAEGANLKGYNHYNNNVSKTHNSTNLTDNMIKFQDLMGKLVEKAQVAVSNGKSEVLMSLNPEYLGKVRLKISMDGDNLIGKIFVDNADVKDIFTKNLDTVISSLNEIGINIEGFDVMLRQDMPNDGGFGEELENAGNRLAFENDNNVEEVKADIKTYIVPERKLNLLI